MKRAACSFVLMIWCREDGPADFTSVLGAVVRALMASFSRRLFRSSFMGINLRQIIKWVKEINFSALA